jgi:hypothetical protein
MTTTEHADEWHEGWRAGWLAAQEAAAKIADAAVCANFDDERGWFDGSAKNIADDIRAMQVGKSP